jgi:uncharacterized UPF0160 family protein
MRIRPATTQQGWRPSVRPKATTSFSWTTGLTLPRRFRGLLGSHFHANAGVRGASLTHSTGFSCRGTINKAGHKICGAQVKPCTEAPSIYKVVFIYSFI